LADNVDLNPFQTTIPSWQDQALAYVAGNDGTDDKKIMQIGRILGSYNG